MFFKNCKSFEVSCAYPIISNWEYRILCSPLKNDISTKRFEISNDLHIQLLGAPKTRKELYYSRRARFELNKWIDKSDPENINGLDYWWNEGRKTWNYLDYLMEQIPGKDNYLANLTDGTAQTIHFNDNEYINSGYYSRYYGLSDNDAMGSTKHRRSYLLQKQHKKKYLRFHFIMKLRKLDNLLKLNQDGRMQFH